MSTFKKCFPTTNTVKKRGEKQRYGLNRIGLFQHKPEGQPWHLDRPGNPCTGSEVFYRLRSIKGGCERSTWDFQGEGAVKRMLLVRDEARENTGRGGCLSREGLKNGGSYGCCHGYWALLTRDYISLAGVKAQQDARSLNGSLGSPGWQQSNSFDTICTFWLCGSLTLEHTVCNLIAPKGLCEGSSAQSRDIHAMARGENSMQANFLVCATHL